MRTGRSWSSRSRKKISFLEIEASEKGCEFLSGKNIELDFMMRKIDIQSMEVRMD
jgi:hypothetical protein